MNPFTGQPLTKISALKDLPMMRPDIKANLFALLNTRDLIMIQSSTGSGKSVCAPSFILEYFKYEKHVICTEPRTLNASSIATSVAELLYDEAVGNHVGYRYKYNNKTSPSTLLTYTTDGTLVSKGFKDPMFSEYAAVIIDETHERNMNIDILLYLAKMRLKIKDPPSPKFIIMSATLQAEQFREYFHGIDLGELMVEGRAFPIEQRWLDKPISMGDYQKKILEIIVNIVNKDTSGDILVFLPATKDIEQMCSEINRGDYQKKLSKKVVCLPLYSALSDDAKELAKDETKYRRLEGNPEVKLVLSTNLAETGVTVKGIRYVIDSGYEYESGFNPQLRQRILDIIRIAQSNVRQRIGRAGRTAPGISYHMYTEAEFSSMKPFADPEIRTANIDTLIIRLSKHSADMKVESILGMLIQPPDSDRVKATLKYLNGAGVFSGGKLSPLGICVHKLNTEVAIAKFLIACRAYGVDSPEALVYSAILTIDINWNSWTRRPSKQSPDYRSLMDRLDRLRERFANNKGEIFAIRALIHEYNTESGLRNSRRILNTRSLDEVNKYVRSVGSSGTYGEVAAECLNIVPKGTDEDKILSALQWAYADQTAVKSGNKYASESYAIAAEVQTEAVKHIGEKILYTEAARILGKNKFNGVVNIV